MEQDDFDNAESYYERAVDYKPNKYFTPVYLTKLAIAKENGGDLAGAINSYNRIIEEYATSEQIHDARKHKSRLEALAAEL